MRTTRMTWTSGGFMAGLVAALTMPAFASNGLAAQMTGDMQNDELQFELRAGTAIPGSQLNDIVDSGLAVGGAANWWFSDRFAVRLDGNIDVLPGADDAFMNVQPDTRLYHYGGGVLVDLTPQPATTRWSLTTSLGLGAVTMDTDDFVAGTSSGDDFTETYLDANAGLHIGYHASDDLKLAIGVQSYVAFLDEEDTTVFAENNPALLPFGTSATFPITATIQWTIPGGASS